jgi:hypothetical protein
MANQDDYLIPFGVDAKQFFADMNAIDQGFDNTAANVVDATKGMQKAFNDASNAGEKLGNTLTVDAEKAAALRDQAKTLGKELGAALSGKGVSGEFEKKVIKFNELLTKFSTNANRPIKFNIDTAKLEQFEKMLMEGADELKVLNQVLEHTKQQLATMDPNSQEFQALNAQLQIAEGFLEGVAETTEKVNTKNKSLKTELREIKAALAEMELAGQDNTAEFERLAIRGGQLEDQIGDISARVRVLASDTKYIDAGVQAIQALAGGFAAAQGAAALFGSENEDVNRGIQKVTGAMAILQGIQTAANALNKDSALSVLLFSRAQTTAAVTTGTMTAATVAQTGATVAATSATRAFTAALLANPLTAVLVVLAAAVAALIAFTDESDEAEAATERLNRALESQALLLDLDEASLRRRTSLLVAQAKAQGKTEAEITTIEGQALAERINLRRAALQEFTKLYNDTDARRLLSADDNKKLEDELLKRQAEIADDETEIQIKRLERNTELQKQEQELEKKAIEAAKKAAEERKRILEQQIKFTAELEKERVDAIGNQYQKERAQAIQAANQRIAELQAEKSLSAKAEKDKQEIIKQLRANLLKQLGIIDKKEVEDRAALQLRAAQLTIQYREEGIVQEIETIRLGYDQKRAEINEQFKDEADLRQQLIEQLNEAQIREQKKAQDAFTNNALKLQEEQAVLEVETATKFLPDLPRIEEQKQIEVLRVKLKYAQKQLEAVLAQGNAENSIVVLQAKKQVQELTKALNGAIEEQAGQGLDWFEVLGLGDLSDDQRKAVTAAARSALNSISEITGAIVEQYQRQIDKKQEVIDQIDNEIDDLEDRLEKEKDLRDKGFANNVDLLQAELDEKKKAREEEMRHAEELQKRQQQLQRVQLVIDTAAQASNLITSATQIFKALSGIPFIGVPLAITTIALMTGAFVAAKVKAFQLVNDQKQTFGGGGWIDGRPHSQGGEKYYSADGKKVKELEDGEHVTNRRQAARYAELLDAINNDDISGMNEEALRAMLEGMGIRMSTDAPREVIKVVRERNELRQAALLGDNADGAIGEDIKSINQNVSYLADRERARVERWEDEKFYYTKTGTKTVKIKK